MTAADVQPAPTPAAARGERRRARTRAAILDAAEVVFARDGYDGARIEEIAEAADVSVGSIYTHFDGKRGLYLQLVDRALTLFADYMRRVDDPTLGPLQRVLAGGDAYLRFHLDHPGAFHFLAYRSPGTRPLSGDDETEARIRGQVGALLQNFAAEIDGAVAAGEARPVDSLRLTHYLWGSWNGVIALREQPDGLRISDEEIAQILELARWMLREALAAPALRDADGAVGDRVPLPHIR
ncbi:TetR/AcrR family transcriptional regulator [Mycobacterium sp. Y57]|uniref:TetR/AcrR family transcriptional regulator n=1 Tax=Mycolicibacterium xanthum TaxID=2796469 RepID=UPI001C859E19|nr:TetR/AcrR family transcriptional regulator [Mycolicibacterium xanthum]MBX7431838.1 TetR/AcrR family transcriptional regulator [Mycolicibacterium xanthum]